MLRRLREWLASTRPPASEYLAAPPSPLLALGWRPFLAVPWRLARSLLFLVRHTLTPYSAGPSEPARRAPEVQGEFSELQLDQCRRIYDEVEGTREVLEDKAKAVFSLITFLVPVSVATAIFILGRAKLEPTSKLWAIALLAIVTLLLLLAYTAASRAVFVRQRSQLFLGSVIDEKTHAFREFDRGFYARGLLWCASMNAATNGHVGEFTKAAQVFTALAVAFLAAAAVPVGGSLLHPPEQVTTVGGSVSVHGLQDIASALKQSVQQSHEVMERLRELERAVVARDRRIESLESEVRQKRQSVEDVQGGAPPP